jgi:hypothetical protein
MKCRMTRRSWLIVLALFSLTVGLFQMGTGWLQPARASAQIGTTRFTARNIIAVPFGHTVRISVGNTEGSRNAPFYVSYQASLSNSEILYKSERFEVPFGTWLYSDVVLERAGETLQQVMLQVDVDVPRGSRPFGSLVIYNTANMVGEDTITLTFGDIGEDS